eukprot:TRINITY_DN63782_c0_g1_i1.p1 TRINITY_DN63782_c0_g1~~TRINITY_DN63782_c0_g1_i1.p1  ORF type:complete len:233 (-),score=32.62 TRINITY_DN63782_c0_g1_i1:269-967(-)
MMSCSSFYQRPIRDDTFRESFYSSTGQKNTARLADGKFHAAFSDGFEYWNERYLMQPGSFDWLEGNIEVLRILRDALKVDPSSKLLHPGCGNSELPKMLHDAGYCSIVNIDVSEVVIEQMREKYVDQAGHSWLVMDATSMRFANESFDIIIDKGMLDTFACTRQTEKLNLYMREVARVLRFGGLFLCCSFAEPCRRIDCLKSEQVWKNIDIVEIPTSCKIVPSHFIYVCSKS